MKRLVVLLSFFISVIFVNSCGLLSLSDYQTLYNTATSYYNSQAPKTNGAYLGIATTDEKAGQLAKESGYSYYKWSQSLTKSKGYSRFNWYSTTGDVFGYN